MADVEPLRALHYDLSKTGGLQDVVAPPYDVIDAEQRVALAGESPYNVVRIDLPEGGDPYANAAQLFDRWREEDVIIQDPDPAFWLLEQDYTGPDGRRRTRTGFFARVKIEEYGPGRVRPHERTHPGPKEDRLRLTRATRTNLSPIFSLFDDDGGQAAGALAASRETDPWGEATDNDGTVNRLWHVTDPATIAQVKHAAAPAELLIADGHHRYETARIYAEEVGGEGPHRYVLMCLVALQDPGLTVFPTHRLLKNLRPDQHETLANALRANFDIELLDSTDELAPGESPDAITLGYIDAHFQKPFRVTLKDQGIADRALNDHAEPYRRLDTAVLEALILKGALDMTDEDIDHLTQLGYERDNTKAIELVTSGRYDAAFLMAPIPIEHVQAVAAAGESMPPKSTYFFPKVPTGLLFNPLSET
ncbi:MAG TPA: DUF1015 domain-containing protein [Solirubrobacteraceae bacterium]|jgi:uncharacterized protein (DUF1015 family)